MEAVKSLLPDEENTEANVIQLEAKFILSTAKNLSKTITEWHFIL